MLLTIIIALGSIICLLTLHEFGHFVIAKKFGVRVDEFGIGYPPRLIGRKIGETVYSLNLIPFGAFVRIAGEEGEEKDLEDSRSFRGKAAWQKASIILGGVVSFWIVAVILLSVIFMIGAPQAISDDENGSLSNPRVQILAVAPNSPAEKSGMKVGDTIKDLEIQSVVFQVQKVKEVQLLADQYKGKEIALTVQRGQNTVKVFLTPRISPPSGEGAMGVALARVADKSYPWWLAPVRGASAALDLTKAVVSGWWEIINNLIQKQGMPKGVQFMGPIGIGSLIGQAAQAGLVYFLQFIAVISVYLAVFNILPIPALDGGKLLFIIIEKIKGSPISQKIEQKITIFFFGLLILLMVFVTAQDIIRIFTSLKS